MNVSWFSAGVSSAVATKFVIAELDKIIYTHIDDQHPDTMRFVKDCEAWFGKPVEILKHELCNVENACLASSYMNSPHGGPCTRILKKRVRKVWERKQTEPLTYYWGIDSDEQHRCARIEKGAPNSMHRYPLIEHGINKEKAHQILMASGIKRPAMYDLGYHNNNCVGCVKGGMGYWNKIRTDFPEVFAARAALERRIGATCINGIYLDELDPEAGRKEGPIVGDCGIMCEVMGI